MRGYAESSYENAVLQLFQEQLGYIYGPDVARDYHSPLYEDVLLPSLRRVNPTLPMDALNEAVYKLKNFESGTLLQKNIVFTDYLQNGVPVKYVVNGEERSTLVYLVDYKNPDNNDFTIANQWTVVENSEKRPDVILFINGLPLVVVELKSPLRRGDGRLRRIPPAPELYARNSFAVRLQRRLRHERHDPLQGRDDHLRRGPVHGVENNGRQL